MIRFEWTDIATAFATLFTKNENLYRGESETVDEKAGNTEKRKSSKCKSLWQMAFTLSHGKH